MKNGKIQKTIAAFMVILALGLGLLAWKMSRDLISESAQRQVKTSTPYPVVVAVKPLIPGEPIQADAVRMASMSVPVEGAFTDLKNVVGKSVETRIAVGEPVLVSRMLGASSALNIAQALQPGERAVAIRVDDVVGVGGYLRPGDWVDVLVSFRRSMGEVDQTQSQVLVSHLRVLAYGQHALNVPAAAPDKEQKKGKDEAKTAVLAVPEATVTRLAMASEAGKVLLALRHPQDGGNQPDLSSAGVMAAGLDLVPPSNTTALVQDRQRVSLAELTGSSIQRPEHKKERVAQRPLHVVAKPKKTTPKLPPAEQVDVYRGADREVINF